MSNEYDCIHADQMTGSLALIKRHTRGVLRDLEAIHARSVHDDVLRAALLDADLELTSALIKIRLARTKYEQKPVHLIAAE